MPIPTPAYNIASLPHVDDREPLAADPGLALTLARGEGYLAEVRHGWRETMAVETTTGAIDHVVVLPGNTGLPIVTAAVTGSFFLCLLAGYYWLSLVPIVGVIALGWRWAWVLGWREEIGSVSIGRDQADRPIARPRVHPDGGAAPSCW